MLGICVFMWGLGYKLSLYELNQPGIHQIPAAKLLSRNEDSNAADTVRDCLSTISQKASSGFLLGLIISLCSCLGSADRGDVVARRELLECQGMRSAAALTAFFFRPPPSLVL